jgi:uncharacterized protein (DUF1778 family)
VDGLMYALKAYKIRLGLEVMARSAVEHNERMAQRIRPEDKRLIMRAATLNNQALSDFVVETSLLAAREVIARAEQVQLSERDSLRVLEALENPPSPTPAMLAALRALPSEA